MSDNAIHCSPLLISVHSYLTLIKICLIGNQHSPHSPCPLYLHSWTQPYELWPKHRAYSNQTAETIHVILQPLNALVHLITLSYHEISHLAMEERYFELQTSNIHCRIQLHLQPNIHNDKINPKCAHHMLNYSTTDYTMFTVRVDIHPYTKCVSPQSVCFSQHHCLHT